MLCNLVKNNKYWKLVFGVGVITLVFGLIASKGVYNDTRNIAMIKGMFTGLGAAFTAIGGIKLILNKLSPAEKLKSKEINLKDERNIQITRISFSVSSTVATILFAILAFLLVGLDYIVPAFITIGAMYIQIFSFFIARRYHDKKM